MVQRVEITMVCDNCKKPETPERPVVTHEVTVDRKAARTVDACDPCWNRVYVPLEKLLALGTPVKRRRRAG